MKTSEFLNKIARDIYGLLEDENLLLRDADILTDSAKQIALIAHGLRMRSGEYSDNSNSSDYQQLKTNLEKAAYQINHLTKRLEESGEQIEKGNYAISENSKLRGEIEVLKDKLEGHLPGSPDQYANELGPVASKTPVEAGREATAEEIVDFHSTRDGLNVTCISIKDLEKIMNNDSLPAEVCLAAAKRYKEMIKDAQVSFEETPK